ncbi:MAG: hypothetical protein KDB61_11770, partial [Planctomycetes bacterium]|nr:hypothetical protein [Planctomycetota bacterium]
LREFLDREGLAALPHEAQVLLERGYSKLIERAPVHIRWSGDLVAFGDVDEVDHFAGTGDPDLFCGPVDHLKMRWVIASGVLGITKELESLDVLEARQHKQRTLELSTKLSESSDPIMGDWKHLYSSEDALRYNLLMAAELQWALRQNLDLSEVPFPDPLGEPLNVIDDGERMTFDMFANQNIYELSIKH